jgi:hypothetical protein
MLTSPLLLLRLGLDEVVDCLAMLAHAGQSQCIGAPYYLLGPWLLRVRQMR